jgi:dTDP-4-dehydrorhamnose 3,5-epimerase
MKAEKTTIPGVLILTPKIFSDERGFFQESYNQNVFKDAGISLKFVQDNHSKSSQGVIRGLHFQEKNPQGKLVRCVQGEILDVVVDIRSDSPTFGLVLTVKLNQENKKQIWIPPGLAHGFSVLSETAEFLYKVTDFYDAEDEAGIRWNDPELGIDWQVKNPQLSKRDQNLPLFHKAKKSLSQSTHWRLTELG